MDSNFLFRDGLLMARELESLELFDPDPVNPLSDHDLDVFAVANIAPENASAALPAHSIADTPTRADPSGGRRRTPALADALSLAGYSIVDDLGENDRSATGYLTKQEFEATADAFNGRPKESVRGWERAADAPGADRARC